jgi:NTE family protein
MATRALVLGGGGPVGIAWETGIVAGLAQSGIDVSIADFVLGTSAGSVVGASLASGITAADLLERELALAEQIAAVPAAQAGPTPDLMGLMAIFAQRPATAEPGADYLKKFGDYALAAETISEEAFAQFFAQLPSAPSDWPRQFACTAIDAHSGEFHVWRREHGLSLSKGVPSSCSVPGIFPPISIGERRYIDGGMRSPTNADLAKGHDKVLVVAVVPPMARAMMLPNLNRELDVLREAGKSAELIIPDDGCADVFGVNLMDGSRRGPIALAGVSQGQREAERISAFWS